MPILLRQPISSWNIFSNIFTKFAKLIAWQLLFCILFTHSLSAAPLNVSVVLSEEGGVYQEYSDALSSQLNSKNVVLRVVSTNGSVRGADLIIAVGMKAATLLATLNSAAIINVFVPKEGHSKLLHDFPKRTNQFSAIYLDQPIERQLDLISAALPDAHHIGLLYSKPPYDVSSLRLKASERKLVLHEQSVNATISLPSALQSLLRNSDVILALPDTDIYNVATLRNILLTTYRVQIPVIGFSSSFVRAGGLCAVFSTPAQIAAQTVRAITRYEESNMLPAAQYAQEFDVLVNTQVTRSLNLNIPSAIELRGKIGGNQ